MNILKPQRWLVSLDSRLKGSRGHWIHSPGSRAGLMLISHLCIAWIQCENYQDVCLLVKAHFGWARFGWAGDLSQAKLGVSPHWDHYEVRALIFPELLQQPGQGDGVGKTIKKARKKKNQNQVDKIKDFCSWHSERTDPFRSIRTFLSLTHL